MLNLKNKHIYLNSLIEMYLNILFGEEEFSGVQLDGIGYNFQFHTIIPLEILQILYCHANVSKFIFIHTHTHSNYYYFIYILLSILQFELHNSSSPILVGWLIQINFILCISRSTMYVFYDLTYYIVLSST